MFCEKCGKEIPDGSAFCEFCGAAVGTAVAAVVPAAVVPAPEAVESMKSEDEIKAALTGKKKNSKEIDSEEDIEGQKVSENIYLCSDGKYRWIYEYDMLRNPALLITILKVMSLSFGIVMLFLILINLIDGNFRYWDADTFAGFFRGFFLLLLFFFVQLYLFLYLPYYHDSLYHRLLVTNYLLPRKLLHHYL